MLKKTAKFKFCSFFYKRVKKCRGGQIRTDDLLLPKQARYRATLHPERISKKRECKYTIILTTTKN